MAESCGNVEVFRFTAVRKYVRKVRKGKKMEGVMKKSLRFWESAGRSSSNRSVEPVKGETHEGERRCDAARSSREQVESKLSFNGYFTEQVESKLRVNG